MFGFGKKKSGDDAAEEIVRPGQVARLQRLIEEEYDADILNEHSFCPDREPRWRRAQATLHAAERNSTRSEIDAARAGVTGSYGTLS